MSRHGWSDDPKTDEELRKKYGPSVHEPCVQRARGYQIMVRKIAQNVKEWIPKEALLDCHRASGEALCTACGLQIRDHLELDPTFHLGCDGEIWKT